MKVFLSSTFRDLIPEREAVLSALQRKRQIVLAMEHFLAASHTSVDVALGNLRNSDVVLLVIGSKAGSLLPDHTGGTYTSAEYDEAVRLGKSVLPFVKIAKRRGSSAFAWRNGERNPAKQTALDNFKNKVGAAFTWDTFKTPDELALNVVLALERWDAEGRPGARKTFSTAHEYFRAKAPQSVGVRLLNFEANMFGRDAELQAVTQFADDQDKRVCIVNGRGGIGKTKLLHDWASRQDTPVMFLKDEPVWYEDSHKEVPVKTKFLIVDDANRQESLGKVLQFVLETQGQRGLKLILSTRPGGLMRLSQNVFRCIDPGLVTTLPEIEELNRTQSEALAREILGQSFSQHAEHLAEVAGNSPLVIVAGGLLIAERKIDPSALTTLEQFRAVIFNRFLDEMNLHGPDFDINPPKPVLSLIAALGPLDTERHEFQVTAASFFGRRPDEILSTIDALAKTGIITARGKPIRILPDVLSDFTLEEACVGATRRSNRYADAVYYTFGAHYLKSLMRNLSELDWRLDRNSTYGLRILDDIWSDILTRFRGGDELERQRMLVDLGGTAIYQPRQILSLAKVALENLDRIHGLQFSAAAGRAVEE